MLSSPKKEDRKSRRSSLQRIGAAAGIAIPIIFATLVITASFLRPGYNQVIDIISLLGVGPNAIIQNINFVVAGVLSIPFGAALGSTLANLTGRKTRMLTLDLLIFGAAVVLAGVFLSLVGVPIVGGTAVPELELFYAHTIVSLVGFVTIIVAQFLAWKVIRNSDASRLMRYGKYSLISGIVSTVFLTIFFLTFESPIEGLTERLLVAAPLIWVEVTGINLRSL